MQKYVDIGKRVKQEAKKRGLTNTDIAKILHVTNEKTISTKNSGINNHYNKRDLELLAEEWEVRLEFLSCDTEFSTDQEEEEITTIRFFDNLKVENEKHRKLWEYLFDIGFSICFFDEELGKEGYIKAFCEKADSEGIEITEENRIKLDLSLEAKFGSSEEMHGYVFFRSESENYIIPKETYTDFIIFQKEDIPFMPEGVFIAERYLKKLTRKLVSISYHENAEKTLTLEQFYSFLDGIEEMIGTMYKLL